MFTSKEFFDALRAVWPETSYGNTGGGCFCFIVPVSADRDLAVGDGTTIPIHMEDSFAFDWNDRTDGLLELVCHPEWMWRRVGPEKGVLCRLDGTDVPVEEVVAWLRDKVGSLLSTTR